MTRFDIEAMQAEQHHQKMQHELSAPKVDFPLPGLKNGKFNHNNVFMPSTSIKEKSFYRNDPGPSRFVDDYGPLLFSGSPAHLLNQ